MPDLQSTIRSAPHEGWTVIGKTSASRGFFAYVFRENKFSTKKSLEQGGGTEAQASEASTQSTVDPPGLAPPTALRRGEASSSDF